MTRRITIAVAVVGLLSLTAGTDALAQKANPCGAKNPCAAKPRGATPEPATVKTEDTRAPQVRSTRQQPTVFAGAGGVRPPGPPPLDTIESP